jgi:hypothetical protein
VQPWGKQAVVKQLVQILPLTALMALKALVGVQLQEKLLAVKLEVAVGREPVKDG